jgi:hypothetical protein
MKFTKFILICDESVGRPETRKKGSLSACNIEIFFDSPLIGLCDVLVIFRPPNSLFISLTQKCLVCIDHSKHFTRT